MRLQLKIRAKHDRIENADLISDRPSGPSKSTKRRAALGLTKKSCATTVHSQLILNFFGVRRFVGTKRTIY